MIVAIVIIGALYYASTAGTITGSTIIETKKYDYTRTGNPDYYSLLPPKPEDFNQVKLMWVNGIIRDVPERVNESYWKQPEWFPFYEENFVGPLEMLIEVGDREPIWGLGIFDAQIYRRINQEWLKNPYVPETSGHGIVEIGNESVIIKHRFWVRAVPGAAKHFGVGVSVVYPKEALLFANAKWGIKEEEITQDPEETKKYIKALTYEKDSGETEFTLGIYWPKLQPDYIKEVEVEVEIDKNTPKGKYIVQVDAAAPSREYQHEQSLKYGLLYTDPNIGMFKGPNRFKLFIEII